MLTLLTRCRSHSCWWRLRTAGDRRLALLLLLPAVGAAAALGLPRSVLDFHFFHSAAIRCRVVVAGCGVAVLVLLNGDAQPVVAALCADGVPPAALASGWSHFSTLCLAIFWPGELLSILLVCARDRERAPGEPHSHAPSCVVAIHCCSPDVQKLLCCVCSSVGSLFPSLLVLGPIRSLFSATRFDSVANCQSQV